MALRKHTIAFTIFCLIVLTAQSAGAVSTQDCLACHDDPSLVSEREIPLAVDPEIYRDSIHGESGIECTDCHFDLSDAEDFPHDSLLAKVDCSMCHDDEFEDYKTSSHGERLGPMRVAFT